ncbi:hypothetical protein K491DRAFT_674506 [Lophiostoma macrostomum CBS 122681]|uniref:2EXR domain-containing protein n=1 Tax=Lophiostoma macrostomum CBS 122681 TaxID=1314788 RepID=A0A6A6TPQ9_9PLEO|nr:hypothetical protein K491DRAFT_674506 [Lophiostoma macrostomum CBS 122681]
MTPQSTFHLFPKLPGELRTLVWQFALENDSRSGERIIEFYACNPDTQTISLAISPAYPALFAVSKEARIEAMQAQGGEIVRLDSGYAAHSGEEPTKVYINFRKDTMFISDRFHANPGYHGGFLRLDRFFHTLMPLGAVRKTTRLLLSISERRRAEWDRWSGEGLEYFSGSALAKVTLVTESDIYLAVRTLEEVNFFMKEKVHVEVLVIRGASTARFTVTDVVPCEALPFNTGGLLKGRVGHHGHD